VGGVGPWWGGNLVGGGRGGVLSGGGDWIGGGEWVACCPRPRRAEGGCLVPPARHYLMLEEVFNRAPQFDLVHFHIDYLHFPLSRRSKISQLTTLHGRLDIPDLELIYRQFHDMPLVSISDAQRRPIPSATWLGTIHP